MGLDSLNCISFDELTISAALSMSLENVDRFDIVLSSKNRLLLDGSNRIDH